MKSPNMSVNEDFSARRKSNGVDRWFISEFVEYVSGEPPVEGSILSTGAGEGAYKTYSRHCNLYYARLSSVFVEQSHDHLGKAER